MAIAELLPGYAARVTRRFVLAADIGQSIDPTAISVIEHSLHRHVHIKDRIPIIQAGETFDVRHLARLPLGLSYVEQVAEVHRLLARPPLNAGCELVIDETGVGRAVGDLFDGHGMAPTRVTITAGDKVTPAGERRWHVSKGLLISTLDARLHNADLRFAANLTEAGAMENELRDFRRKVSAAGRFTFEARVGQHDDLVLSVAIGLWSLIRPQPAPAAFGTYSISAKPGDSGLFGSQALPKEQVN